jgi:hypothetical protein
MICKIEHHDTNALISATLRVFELAALLCAMFRRNVSALMFMLCSYYSQRCQQSKVVTNSSSNVAVQQRNHRTLHT